jgi:hypothetical protein
MIRDEPPETMTSSKNSCSVCDEALEVHTEAFCNQCGLPYHLNQRTDLPGRDCGEVWISEEHLALEFACNTCLHPVVEVLTSLADILDVAEAALAAGVSEAALTSAAESGEVRHRRTASGTYLFERRDVAIFLQGRR